MRAAWTLASSLSRRSQQHAGGLPLCWTWPYMVCSIPLDLSSILNFHQITDRALNSTQHGPYGT